MYYNRDRLLVALLILALIFSAFTLFISSEGTPDVSARAAALYIPENESFIYNKNMNSKLAMASTTKIMTALLALETLNTDEVISAYPEAVGREGSSIYLRSGDRITVGDLVYAVMLASANDAAEVLAYRMSGGIEAFSQLMNNRARSIGALDTSFKNPHGLDADGHYTTAHDLALIAAEALKNEDFKEIAATYKKEITVSDEKRIIVNHNKLLKMYDGCIGIKTGYTKKSGRSLVSAAERDGFTLISVTIDAPSDWRDHKEMLDYGYSLFSRVLLSAPGEFTYRIPVIGSDTDSVTVKNTETLSRVLECRDTEFETHVKLSRYVSAPVKEGDILGKVIFTKNGELLGMIDLTAQNTANTEKKHPFFG